MEESAVTEIFSRIGRNLTNAYERADRWSGGLLGVLRQSIERFSEMRGAEAAASLAYFALFSLFPLTLVLVAILGFVLSSEDAFRQTLLFVTTIFPFSGDLVERNLSDVVEASGPIGVIGLLGAVWSATGFFTTLARNINRAWPSVKLRGLVHGRLVGLGMIGALFLLLLLSLLSTTLINLLPVFIRAIGADPAFLDSRPSHAVLRLVPAVFTFLMFTGLYRWVPNKVVRWKAVLVGGLVVAIIWELAKSAFALYLRSGLARYEIIYGSLGTLVVLMAWIYLSNLIALLGAHLVATLDLRAERQTEALVPAPAAEHAAPKRARG